MPRARMCSLVNDFYGLSLHIHTPDYDDDDDDEDTRSLPSFVYILYTIYYISYTFCSLLLLLQL